MGWTQSGTGKKGGRNQERGKWGGRSRNGVDESRNWGELWMESETGRRGGHIQELGRRVDGIGIWRGEEGCTHPYSRNPKA
jgi:hypothetical protein